MKKSRKIFLLMSFFSISMTTLSVASKIDIRADRFELNAKTSEVEAIGHVVVKQGDVIIKGEKARYKKDSQLIKMKGNILIKRGSLLLKAERVIVNGEKQKLSAEGGVSFGYKEFKGTSKHILYNLKQQKLELTGNPIIRKNTDEVMGEKIVIDILKEVIKAEGDSHVSFTLKQ